MLRELRRLRYTAFPAGSFHPSGVGRIQLWGTARPPPCGHKFGDGPRSPRQGRAPLCPAVVCVYIVITEVQTKVLGSV